MILFYLIPDWLNASQFKLTSVFQRATPPWFIPFLTSRNQKCINRAWQTLGIYYNRHFVFQISQRASGFEFGRVNQQKHKEVPIPASPIPEKSWRVTIVDGRENVFHFLLPLLILYTHMISGKSRWKILNGNSWCSQSISGAHGRAHKSSFSVGFPHFHSNK